MDDAATYRLHRELITAKAEAAVLAARLGHERAPATKPAPDDDKEGDTMTYSGEFGEPDQGANDAIAETVRLRGENERLKKELAEATKAGPTREEVLAGIEKADDEATDVDSYVAGLDRIGMVQR